MTNDKLNHVCQALSCVRQGLIEAGAYLQYVQPCVPYVLLCSSDLHTVRHSTSGCRIPSIREIEGLLFGLLGKTVKSPTTAQ